MTTEQHEILVLGATGKTGRRLVRRLRDGGLRVRAASRSSGTRFDWDDPATWDSALAGTGAVYLVAPEDPAPVEGFVDQAVTAGVRRFVALSGRGLDQVGPDFGQGMAAAERAVRASGVDWAIVRANNFHQNFDEDLWHAPLRAGRLALPIGAVPEPFVDAEDIAEVAAALLTRDGLGGRTYELSGPDALRFDEAVDVIARAAGRSIRYVELTPEEYRAELRADGHPEAAVRALDALFALHRAGHTAEPSDGVRQVLGREPRTLADYAERAAAAGAWA
ncbi:NAD(P)H-binding protein [Kitasatospora xanthocidica]|uniref:NmrA family NAD(P)-binding protein n=1 Tax=Kitasatospora xanthocidica TaxID=83382 RepID=UPI0036E3ED4E